MAYRKAEAVRDELAKEMADLYPAFAEAHRTACARRRHDREIDRINTHALPRGADRLLVAELKARGLPWVVNSIETHHGSRARIVYGHRESSDVVTQRADQEA